MITLGIDPGTARIGYALLEKNQSEIQILSWGCFELSKIKKQAERLRLISQKLREVIDLQKPELLALEKIFFAKNTKTAIAVAEARGVILNTAMEKNLGIREFTPLEVKMALTGYGRAQKDQVQKMVKTILKLETIPKPDDAADAIAIALTACYTSEILK